MKTHRALAVYAFAALLCSFLVVRWVFSAPLLKADDTIGLTSADLPQGYQLVADTGFQTREMALVTGTGEKEKHQPYTVHERRQDVALPGQTDADGARISVTMMVFPSVEMAVAYCEQQMEVYVFEGGTLRTDPHWHTSRNDLGDPRLAGKGGAVRSDPTTLLIRYGNVFCQISAGSFNPKCSEAVALLGKIWLEKISRAPAGTVAVGEGSTKPGVTGGPQGTASSMNIDNDFVRVKIDPNRACVTNLTFKRGSNAELIASNWGSYLIDLGTDPRLGKYLKEGWVVEKVEHQANYSKFLFRHPSGFINEMLLSWGEGGVEVRCDITAPESVEISGVLRPGGGWEGGRDKWAFPTMEGIKTGSFTYPGPHIPLYPPDHSWGTPTENWIALWDDQVNEVYGFTFSGGSKAKICNGAGTDQHILIPEGTSRVSFHIVKPKPGTPYEAIRALINAPSTLIGRQTGKSEGYPSSGGDSSVRQVIFEDTFDKENGGKGAENFNNFSQWVVKDGSVDLIGNGFYDWLPGRGLYVDLDGSTGKAGLLETRQTFLLKPGRYLLSFDLAGPRIGGADTVTVQVGNVFSEDITLAPKEPVRTIKRMITISSTTSVTLRFKHSGGDNEGLLLDNVRLERLSSSDETVTGKSEDTSSEGKPQGVTGRVPAGTGQAVVIDETGSVTQAQISKLQDGLAQLRDKYGVSIAIVFTGFLSKDAQKERSKEYYEQLRREGKLTDPSAVCLLWAGEGRTGINWHRDKAVDKLLPWEKVEKAWDKAANSKPPGAPLALELIAQLLATPTPSGGEAKMYHLSGGNSSVPLGTPYKASDGFLRFEMRFSKPGSVLDTVGINAAKAGDLAIWILPDNVLVWQIYHPGIASSLRAPNGWHILRSQGSLQPERWYSVEVTWGSRGARLVIDGKVHAQVDVNLPLSGSKIFLGDFPGDAQWAPRYEVSRSFTGDVRNIVFGP